MTVNDIENIVQILFPDNSILYREEKILSLKQKLNIIDEINLNRECLCRVSDIDEENVGTIEINRQCPFHG